MDNWRKPVDGPHCVNCWHAEICIFSCEFPNMVCLLGKKIIAFDIIWLVWFEQAVITQCWSGFHWGSTFRNSAQTRGLITNRYKPNLLLSPHFVFYTSVKFFLTLVIRRAANDARGNWSINTTGYKTVGQLVATSCIGKPPSSIRHSQILATTFAQALLNGACVWEASRSEWDAVIEIVNLLLVLY